MPAPLSAYGVAWQAGDPPHSPPPSLDGTDRLTGLTSAKLLASSTADKLPPRSLFGEILNWMLAPFLLLWPVSLAITYLIVKTIANSPFDRALETKAYALAQQFERLNSATMLALPPSARELLSIDNFDIIYYQVLGTLGEFISGDKDLPLPPGGDRPPPGVVKFRDKRWRGAEIRIAYMYIDMPHTDGNERALVQVAETRELRNRLADDIIKKVILPQLVILPLAIALVWFGLSRSLAPLVALREHIRARPPDDLTPLKAKQAPSELMSLIASFNDLLKRFEQNIECQKRFITNAAHQMKTPLAGLRMQAELAQRYPIPLEVQQSLAQIVTSSAHAARLVTQMLTLARAENRTACREFISLNLNDLAQQCAQDWLAPALAKRIDLGYEAPTGHIEIAGNPVMLREMLGNLIDNAIRYTPAGGRVTLRVRRETGPCKATLIEVDDTGPGIPEAERARVVERFYRMPGRESDGSGLGLAIVSEIAALHHGVLSIHDHTYGNKPQQIGTLMRVRLPDPALC